LISRQKQYSFNSRTLQYEAVNNPKKSRVFKFIVRTSLIGGLLSFLFFIFIGSPIEILLNTKINFLQGEYLTLNNKIDSLEFKLHKQIIPSDKYYRELLEIDSLPTTIRFAGSGGSEPGELLNYAVTDDLIIKTNKKVNTLEKQLKVQSESFLSIIKSAVVHNKKFRGIPAIQPVKPTKHIWISSKFGSREDPFTFLKRTHYGIDFVGPKNTKIYATADGTVTLIKESRRGYGKEVVVSHNFGYSTRYAHLNEILVIDGQKVKRGQVIGLMGSTGRSTGTHLHYEVRLNNRPINPIYYYADNVSEEEYNLIVEQEE
jgi:hypothetical protein